jgi:hypothetical protein
MPYFCKYCARPDIAQIFEELKKGVPRTSVVSKFGLDQDKDYGPLGKCFNDHRPHDHAFEVEQSIKRNSKMLTAELRKALPDRATVKDIEQRLQALRKEQRELAMLAKQQNPVNDKGETPMTMERLDKLISDHMGTCLEGYTHWDRLEYILNFQMSKANREDVCKQFLQELEAVGFRVDKSGKVISTPYQHQRRELLPERRPS